MNAARALASSLTSELTAAPWLQLSVQDYFATFNWDNQASPLRQFELTLVAGVPMTSGRSETIGMPWSVNQFFGAMNWDGGALALPVQTTPLAAVESPEASTDLLLTDFSNLFG